MGDIQTNLNSHQVNYLGICRDSRNCKDSPVCFIDNRNGEVTVEGRLSDSEWITGRKLQE
jgi:hypothetical protein